MTQFTFADIPASRRSDPDTSASAIANHRGREANAMRVWWAAKEHPNSTYRELARFAGLDPVETMRRLNDLSKKRMVNKGAARTCTTNGNRMATWTATN